MSHRIDFLLMRETQYRVLNYFTEKFQEAVARQGVDTRLITLTSEGNFELSWNDLPVMTFCFNGIPSSNGELLLCDRIGVPHFSMLVDSPVNFPDMIDSAMIVMGCDDRSGVRILEKMDFTRSFFLPHAVERELDFDPALTRDFDIVFLASYLDHERLKEYWQKRYPKSICQAMEEGIEAAFSDEPVSFLEVFIEAVSKHVPQTENQNLYRNDHILQLCSILETYIKGREREEMIRAITDSEIHIFGNGDPEGKSWEGAVGDQPNVVIHPSVDFHQANEIMKRSKIVLNSSIKNKEGAHERIFSGLACGALVATMDNAFMREEFVDNQEILLFRHSRIDELNERISGFLADESKRAEAAAAGRKKVMANHTWDNRAQTMLETIPRYFESLSQLTKKNQC